MLLQRLPGPRLANAQEELPAFAESAECGERSLLKLNFMPQKNKGKRSLGSKIQEESFSDEPRQSSKTLIFYGSDGRLRLVYRRFGENCDEVSALGSQQGYRFHLAF